MSEMRILLTGGKGFIGREIVAASDSRHEIAAPPHSELDVLDKSKTADVIGAFRPDAVIHLAAMVGKEDCERDPGAAVSLNAGGTRNVAEAAAEAGAFMVFLSSDFVFSGRSVIPCTETDIPSPINVYGETKLAGEKVIEETCDADKYLIVRTSRVFGVEGRNFISALPGRMRREDELKLISDDLSSFTYAPDIAASLEKMLSAGACGLFHLVNEGTCSTWEFGERIRRKIGVAVGLMKVNFDDFDETPPSPRFRMLSAAKFRGTGFERLCSWDEALDKFLKRLNFSE